MEKTQTYTGKGVSPPKKGHHFLHIDDFSKEELWAMLQTAIKARLPALAPPCGTACMHAHACACMHASRAHVPCTTTAGVDGQGVKAAAGLAMLVKAIGKQCACRCHR